MAEYIVRIDESEKNYDEHFVGVLRLYPELIRCKDCKHWYKGLNINYCRIFYDNDLKLYKSSPDDYCSKAERKEE